MLALVLALPLLAATAAADRMPAATPPALGVPTFVQLGSFTGMPPDSLMRGQFRAAFDDVFTESNVPAQRRDADGAWQPAVALPNRFRLLMGSEADDAWTLDVAVGAPPPMRVPARGPGKPARTLRDRRASRGMVVAFTLHVPPVPGGADGRTVVQRYAYSFPSGSGGADLAMPTAGYVFPWADAGRAAGRLALELLHRERGEYGDADRVDITPAARADAAR